MRTLLNTTEQRAVKGFWRQSSGQLKLKLTIYAVIAFVMLTIEVIIELLPSGSKLSMIHIGLLNTGYAIAGYLLLITVLFENEYSRVKERLVFPITRKVYTVAKFLVMLRDVFCLLVEVSIFGAAEIVVFKSIEHFEPALTISNFVTWANYWDGFWLAFSIFSLGCAIVSCLGSFLVKYRVNPWVGLGCLVGVCLIPVSPQETIWTLCGYFLKWLFTPPFILSYLKIWGFAVMFGVLAYLPVRRLEV